MQMKMSRTAVAVCVSTALVAGTATYMSVNSDSGYQLSPEKQAFLDQKKTKKETNPKRYDKPQEAQDFYVKQRAPLGAKNIPTEKYGQAVTHITDMAQYSFGEDKLLPSRSQLRTTGALGKLTDPGVVKEWENIGPGNIGGRTRALIIDPDTPETMYTAGVAGGIWKTTDAGANWLPLDDMMTNLAVTTLVFDPNDSNTIYAGTGEGFFNGDALRGDGVFVSNDAGATWTQLANTAANRDFHYVNKLAASPNVEGRLYAATRAGFFRSDDSGVTWDLLMEAPNTNGCMDLQVRDDLETDELILSCGSFSGATVYRSTDGGDTIEAVIEDELMGRTTIAYAPSNQDIVYALAASNVNDTSPYRLGFYKLFRSADGGETWEVKNSSENENVLNTLLLSNTVFGLFPECGFGAGRSFFNQGWYDNIIEVDPVNPDVVWAGGIDLWRSDDAGENWGTVSRWWADPTHINYAHADQHTIVFHPNYDGDTNKTLYVGNDGGIQRTDNADGGTLGIAGICGVTIPEAVNWTTLNNNYVITQFYHGSVYPDGTTYFGGTQDNGTNRGDDTTGKQNWVEILGGDGGWTAVDPRDTNVIYSETTGLSLRRQEDGATWVGITNGISGGAAFPFITPFMLDGNNPDRLWIGNDRLWRTEDRGDNWVQASAPTLDESVVSEWAVAPGNSDRVMAGTDSGMILISTSATQTDATTQWQHVQPTQGYVSDIAISPTNNARAYATYSTFGVPHIWRTTDGGLTWEPIDNMGQPNGLPDIPVNTIVIDPSNTARLIVGTDIGIFVSVDAGENWSVDGSGFANTSVAHLEINNGNLYAFTHGRSAYRVELSTLPAALPVSTSMDEDGELSFSSSMFSAFNGGTPAMDSIVLLELPANGTLSLDGEAITELAPIALDELGDLTFAPSANFNGEVTIGWHAQAAGEATSTNSDINITVNPVNDAPSFTVNQQVTIVNAGTTDRLVLATMTPDAVPADESEQTVVYSVLPDTLDFAQVSINENTGELSVIPVEGKSGEVIFVVTANDQQAENNTHKETVGFRVEEAGGNGSFGWLSLLMLPLVMLRRKLRK